MPNRGSRCRGSFPRRRASRTALHDRTLLIALIHATVRCFSVSFPRRPVAILAFGLLAGLLGAKTSFAQSPPGGRVLPADFVQHRIYVTAVTTEGDSLRMLTDTGGGTAVVLSSSAVRRTGRPVIDTLQGRRPMQVVPVPAFRTEGPVPQTRAERAIIAPSRRAQLVGYDDGRLGMHWFAGRIWTFDYGDETLRLHDTADELSFAPDHTVDLAFKTDSTGTRVGHHPRVEASIDGTTRSFLFDTGATTVLTDSAQGRLDAPRRIASGFIRASLFERWTNKHPDWTVVEGASPALGGSPLIRVPEVEIAGHTAGPVWFERRPDRTIQKTLAGSMDRRVAGALGGSLFRHFRITVDYPNARAYFQRLD